MTSAYDFTLPALKGGELDLAAWRGRPLLITNTASKCGFTPQYKGLQHLWTSFGQHDSKGLVIIGVPSDDFAHQEPGSNSEISAFCEINYGVSFPLAAKCHVKGPDAVPLFRWLAENGGFLSRPRWNFYKYLINREGKLVTWFTPLAKPDSARVVDAVARIVAGS